MTRWGYAVALAGLTAFGYLNAAPEALVHDDATLLAPAARFGGVETIPGLFGQSARGGAGGNARLYRPLSMASLALDRSLFGGDPRGYHRTSIALHVAATLVLFGFLAALGAGDRAAFLAALLFGLHPIHTEVVDLAFNRSEILATLGVVGALWWLWAFRARRPVLAWTGAGVIYLLALLCRESAVTLPALAVLVLVLLWPAEDRRTRWRRLAPAAALVLPLLAYLALRQEALGGPAGGIVRSLGAEGIGGAHAPLNRLALVADTVRDYWRMIVWPRPLRASYEDYVARGTLLSVLLHAALITLAAAARRRFPPLTLGIAFFYVALLPSTRLFADPAVLAERFVYLPSAGLAIPVAVALPAWAARQGPEAPTMASAALALAFAVVTLQRNAAWGSRDALWEAEVQASATDWKALVNLAQVRLDQQRFEEALALCDRGLALDPDRAAFHTNRAVALASLGRTAEAEASFARAATLSHDPATHANLARLFASSGRGAEAERSYARAIALETDEALRAVLEGERLLLCRQDVEGAHSAFLRALALSPGLPAAQRGLLLAERMRPPLGPLR